MQTRSLLTALALVAAGVTLGAFSQEHVTPRAPYGFDTLYKKLKQEVDAEHFGRAYTCASELTLILAERRVLVIREALPAVPDDYTRLPQKAAMNAGMRTRMLMGAGMGNTIEQTYNGPEAPIQVTVTLDSPFIQMFQRVFNNPAGLSGGQELIRYGTNMALLETEGKRKTLKLVIGPHMVEAVFEGHDDEFIFAIWDQAAVDLLEAALLN